MLKWRKQEPIALLEEKIAERRQATLSLEGESSIIQRELEENQKRRGRYKEMIQVLTGTTSVIRRIPPEIIAAIIILMLSGVRVALENRAYASVCSISTLWRQTATSTPSLWRSLSLDLDRVPAWHHRTDAGPRLRDSLDGWFSRAGEGAYITLDVYSNRHQHPRRTRGL
jgi:F-box-like